MLPTSRRRRRHRLARYRRNRLRHARYSVDLVLHLVSREFRLRYRRAFIGWIWSVGQPLLRFAVFAYVFTKVIHVGNIPEYPAFLFIGIVAWTWFASGLMSATSSVLLRSDLLLRPGVPRAAAPVVSVLTDMLDFVAALPIIAVFLLFSGGIAPYALLLPVLMLIELLLILGIGMALCSANVYLRDVQIITGLVLLLGFYLTPVFYSRKLLPSTLTFFYDLNPVARLLGAYRDILIYHRYPATLPLLVVAAFSVAVFAAGYAIYHRASATFVDQL
ncbi:MAG: lipopolysaccharide transport system permease protein [Actinomycetota bacterium]|jgi:lipopolysaccharide transport system permease protein|nr:lipopolysaccharide transport system permease protein [Actinomycetota bacterium]